MTAFRSTVAALIASLVLAAPVLADTQTQTASESFTVQTTTTLTGVPASLAYGSGVGGQTLSAPKFTASATTNNANGIKITVEGSALTVGSRLFAIDAYSCGGLQENAVNLNGNGPHEFCAVGSSQTATVPVTSRIQLNATAAPGAYAATLTVKAVEK